MNILYIDCFSGISGDLMVGALLDMGTVDLSLLKRELSKLGLGPIDIQKKKQMAGDIVCTRFYLKTSPRNKKINLRTRNSIFKLLDRSKLAKDVKEIAKEIFLNIFKAESKVHKTPISEIELDELADLDSIVDIVSTAILIRQLNVKKIYASKVPLGRGFINTREGVIPNPAPATMELLKDIPVVLEDVEHELVTPTGAGILKSVADEFDRPFEFNTKKIGYGIASKLRKDNVPNMLRVMLGEVDEESSLASDKVFVIEANLDDTLPLNFEYIIEKLLKEKALDVFINPIVMKKSRPANLLSVITESKYLDNIISTIFNETTTLGVRYYEVKRRKLEREHKLVKTPYGNVRVKIGSLNRQIKTVSPEYEDCKKISLKSNIPLRKVYEVSKDIFSRKHKAKV